MKKSSKLFLCFIHGLFLTWLTLFLAQSNFIHWDDEELAWVSQFIRKQVLSIETKPEHTEFIFINVSYDNSLVDKYDNNGFLIGNQDITDRKKLAYFFEALGKNNEHQAAFCDIRFVHPSPYDSLLEVNIAKTKRLLCSTHDGLDSIPLIQANYSYSDYSNDGSFLKFEYIRKENQKTTPLRLYELINQKEISKIFGLINVNGHYLLNNAILDLRIREYDYRANRTVSDSSNYAIKYVQLGDLIKLDSLLGRSFISDQVKDRIVVLGDFEDRDVHSTVSGSLAGPVILINAYLALKEFDNEVTLWLLIFLVTSYFIVSSFILFDLGNNISHFIAQTGVLSRFQLLIELIGYFLTLFLLSLVCYICFDVQISIILIALYIKFVSWLKHNFFDKKY